MAEIKSTPDLLPNLHATYDAEYGPFNRYVRIETVEVLPGMHRIYLRPVSEVLTKMVNCHEPHFCASDFEDLKAVAILILEAGLIALRQKVAELSHTNGEFDLFVNSNDFAQSDGKHSGSCMLNVNSHKVWEWLLFEVSFLKSPGHLDIFYDDEKTFVGTEKSALVNPYLYPTWITDVFLHDAGEVERDIVPILQQEHQKRCIDQSLSLNLQNNCTINE